MVIEGLSWLKFGYRIEKGLLQKVLNGYRWHGYGAVIGGLAWLLVAY